MPSIDMKGPYFLTKENIDANVSKLIGNYVLGFSDENNEFYVQYVGRSDKNLNKRLKDHIDEGYIEFAFSYCDDELEAYFTECQNYHDHYSTIDNNIHPDKPNGYDFLSCPHCET